MAQVEVKLRQGRCAVRTWRGRGFPQICGRTATVLRDENNRPVCAGHYAQLETDETPEPEPLWKRALAARALEIATNVRAQ